MFSITFLVAATVVVFCFGLLHESISCVDQAGCFKDHCVLKMFNDEYQELIKDSYTKNNCRGKIDTKTGKVVYWLYFKFKMADHSSSFDSESPLIKAI